jgi:Restriction endonuclease
VVLFDGDVVTLIDGAEDYWYDFTRSLGLDAHSYNHTTQVIYVPEESRLYDPLRDALRFDWSVRLVAPDFARIYNDAFAYFGEDSSRLSRLTGRNWRQFEEFLASVFEGQGYRTVLGTGGNDENVDLRLVEHPVYGDRLTLVQAKAYAKPIESHWIAALLGTIHHHRADAGLFVTTSRYLPSAERFAASHAELLLANGEDVARWSGVIAAAREDDAWLRQQEAGWRYRADKVVVSAQHIGGLWASWGLVVAESPTAARIVRLRAIKSPMLEDPLRGTAIPDPRSPLRAADSQTARIRERRYLTDDDEVFVPWDGRPVYYDLAD